MMHCPLCRFALDRYNLRDEMSFNVSVARLRLTSVRCNNFRMGFLSGFHTHGDPNAKIITGGCNATASEPVSRVASKLVQGCFAMKAEDGFVYNVSLLALDRAVSHRLQFIRSLQFQLRNPRNQGDSEWIHEFIAGNLACHIEVLIRMRPGFSKHNKLLPLARHPWSPILFDTIIFLSP